MPKKLKQQGKPGVHKDLKGLDIKVNSFGEIESELAIESINEFLNKIKKQKSKEKIIGEEE